MTPVDTAVRYLAGALLVACAVLGGLARCSSLAATAAHAELETVQATARGDLVTANAKAAADSTTLRETIMKLEADRAHATADLADYRRSHPVHVWVRDPPPPACSGRPAEPAADPPAGPEAGGLLQPAPARDLGPELDTLMAEADVGNESYRLCHAAMAEIRRVLP